MTTQTYETLAARQKCEGCSAACCKMVTFPYRRPQTFLDLDYLRYMLGFQNFEILIDSDGEWSIAVLQTCRHLDATTNLCSLYGTARRPRVCSSFAADQCWYHRNFVSPRPAELIRLDAERFEAVLPHLAFDDLGNIVQAPSWDELRGIAGSEGLPPLPSWTP